MVQQAIDSESIEDAIKNFLDRGPVYQRMREMLANYRDISNSGGWPQVGEGPTLKPGMSDVRIRSIRQRLAVTGELAVAEANGSASFDDGLQAAVVRFQERHNLDADGISAPRPSRL